MKLHIKNFMCWDDYVVDFPVGGLVLVKGESGSGKTTIFRALYWCLYGTLRGVKPHGKNTKTSVKLESYYDEKLMTITRKKNPNRLEVLIGDILYQDITGQHIINEIYGQEIIWKASCYVEQNNRNSFLTSTSAGKMQILNMLAFNTEDPQEIISLIEKHKNLLERDYKNNLGIFTKDIEQNKEKLENYDETQLLNNEEEKLIENDIHITDKNIEDMQIKQRQREISSELLNIFKKELKQVNDELKNQNKPILKEEFENIVIMTTNGLMSIYDEVNELDDEYYSKQKFYIEKRNLLQDDVVKMENNMKNITDCSGLNFEDTRNKEYEYYQNKKICDDCNIKYNKDSLDSNIIELKNLLEEQKNTKKWKIVEEKLKMVEDMCKEKIKNEKELNNIKILENISENIIKPIIIDLDNTKIESIKKEIYIIQTNIEHLIKCKDILSCPYCDGKFFYKNYKLITTDEKKSTDNSIEEHNKFLTDKKRELENEISLQNNYIDKNQKEIKKYNIHAEKVKKENDIINKKNLESQYKIINIKNNIEELEKKINKFEQEISILKESCRKTNTNIMPTNKIENISSKLYTLSQIKIMDLPNPSSKQIYEYNENKKIIKDIEDIKTKILDLDKKITCDIKVLEKISDIKSYLKEKKIWKDNMFHYEKKKKEIQEKINDIEKNLIEDLSKIIEENNNKIKTLTNKLKINSLNKKLKKLHDKLSNDREKIILDLEHIKKIENIKKIAQETECTVLQNVTENLTLYTQNILQELFNNYINIYIKLYKEVKSTKIVKPNVSFEIHYNNNIYDNISSFSGGEADRISLSLTLSLHKLSSSPILILDESLASLDVKTKENVLNVIRNCSNSTVLIVMHDCTEGFFDHVVNV